MKWTLIYFDDQLHNIECLQHILSDRFTVIGSNEPHQLSTLMQQYHPHAFLLDIHMPQMNGHHLFDNIIKHPLYNGCPVFFISGDLSDEIKLSSFEKGGVDFLGRDLVADELGLRLSNKIKFYLQNAVLLELGNLKISMEEFNATINQLNIDLTLLEMRLLSILLRSFPASTTRTEVIRRIWGNELIRPATINTHVANLRPKLALWNYAIKIKGDEIFLQEKAEV